MMHMQANEYEQTHRADEPVHKQALPPAMNPDRYASEMADLDIREAAGEFATGPGEVIHHNDPWWSWHTLQIDAIKAGITCVIIDHGDPEPEGAELILIRNPNY